jgi:peptidoglycan/LPS O-acetylase OafA/YrhL
MLDLSPAHLHLALNHIPIIGLVVASFPIVIGILAQCRTTIATGLLATILCAAAMPTIMESGSKASHNFKDGTTTPALDEAGKNALHMHATRAKKTTPVIYASALLALLALIALIKFPKPATWLAFAVLLGNTASILLAIWTADAGGRIRHQELRPKTPWDEPAENSKPVTTPSPAPSIAPMATPMPSALPACSP